MRLTRSRTTDQAALGSDNATLPVPLGAGSRPHGVIVGEDGAAWVTDGDLNAIARVDAATRRMRRFPLPADRAGANLNAAVFDGGRPRAS